MNRARSLADSIVRQADATGFRAHAVHVLVGDEVATHAWSPDVRRDIHSAAKGVCVLAAGIASDEGLVDLDAPLEDWVSGYSFGSGGGDVTLRHLLSMSSGIDLPWSETLMTDWPDLAVEFLGRDSRGRVFQYSNASTYTAMALLSTRVGDVVEYLQPRLFDPLGITEVEWDRCPNGRIVAGGGLWLRADELARVGRLIRDGGIWNGSAIVSRAWIDAMHSEWVVSGESPGYERYALSGWDGPGAAWRLHGAYGQLVIFAGDAVVTVTADDHFGADAMAAFIASALEAEV